MIHQLLNISRSLFIVDCETTGTDPKTDRIIELGFQQWRAEGMIKEWRSLINPGVPIPPAVTAVHGITDAMVQGCRECNLPRLMHAVPDSLLQINESEAVVIQHPGHEFLPHYTFKDFAANLAMGFSDCDYAGKKIRFDLSIIAAEMRRAGVLWSYRDARIVDADRLEQLAVPRTLSHLHEKYVGYPHDGAHGALSDVRASATVIALQLTAHPNLPRDLDKLHEEQWPGWLCDTGEFRLVNGVATCQFGKHRGKAMRDIPMSYWDWILSADFSEDVYALARNAKLGKFPGEHT